MPYTLSSNATISQDMLNPCSWMFRPRIRLMNLARSQFSLKADLPVGFPYRFNSSQSYYFAFKECFSTILWLCRNAGKTDKLNGIIP